ncbi:penicillin-binding protein 1C [Blastochloris viridis]|nr:penicillin-binding protein 1C [Blastochloris viridis]ALK10364.1 Penicillin-binding protein 1F [Blastochloris viridis]CUU43026.1 Penicillin-binding protein 4 precursor [Blastochloris viridis]
MTFPARIATARVRRRWFAWLAAVLAAAAGALALYIAALGPLDLTVADTRSTVVLDRGGQLLRPYLTAGGRWRLPVTPDEVDPRFLDLLVAVEDRRFDSHAGIDPIALGRAALQLAQHGRVVSGGSTLTMQVARLLEPRSERSFGAKLRQMVRAVQLERRFSKAQILTLYLRLAPYGGNLEGVRAASLSYFGREPKRLSFAESALLVALPQAPEARRPDRAVAAAKKARDRVLQRAVERGVITDADADIARREPVPTARRPVPMLAPHAADAAVAARPTEPVHRLAIDASWQASLERLASDRAARLGPNLSAAIVAIDNASGEVRAYVGSAGYLAAERAGAVDAGLALRSPGSTLKPFIFALAFEAGLAHPETVVDDRPTRYGLYAPENFDLTYQGMVTARRALQLSLNVPAVDILAELGPARLLSRVKAAGVELALRRESPPGLAIALGGLGTRLIDLARLYAGLARGGDVPELVWRVGEGVPPPRARLVEPVAAWYVADILRGAPPPANAAGGRIAFKTGTSYGFRDAWAIGFDRNVTIAVWVGRPDGAAVPGLVGRLAAAPILFDAFSRLGIAIEPVPAPPGVLVATTARLPPPLRQLRKDVPATVAGAARPLHIAFPLDGARLVTHPDPAEDEPAELALKVAGGTPPYSWFVNGVPVAMAMVRREAIWLASPGMARISVVDAGGLSDSVSVRVDATP